MGAAVAVIAAAHQRRISGILDAYRIAGATSPDHGRAPAELDLNDHAREIDELIDAQVLRAGTAGGALYLDETGYVSYRERGDGRRKVAMLIIALLVGVLSVVALFLTRS